MSLAVFSISAQPHRIKNFVKGGDTMLVTNSEFKVSNEKGKGKKSPLMARIARAFGNGLNKIWEAETRNGRNKHAYVELAGCVEQSITEGLSDHKSI